MRQTTYWIALPMIFAALASAQSGSHSLSGSEGYAPSSFGVQMPKPEEGTVREGIYTNTYFGLSFPMPRDWREGYKGPPPSDTGFYVLSQLVPKTRFGGGILISAQDEFFGSSSSANTMALLQRRQQQALASRLQIDSPAVAMEIAGHEFGRLDFSGAGLNHAIFATEIRCHLVIFELTALGADELEKLSKKIRETSFPPLQARAFPSCVKDYASGPNVVRKVDPVQVGPRFTRVPVRIIVDKKGKVQHIHVINALPEQARSVQDSLAGWIFKAYIRDGRPAEVETGILFEFSYRKRSGRVLER